MHIKPVIETLTGKTIKIKLHLDNQSTISLIKNGVTNRRSKHIDVRYRYIHDLVKNNVINIEYCPSEKQNANILTKPLGCIKFEKLRKEIVT